MSQEQASDLAKSLADIPEGMSIDEQMATAHVEFDSEQVELNAKVDPALHKASQKMYDILVAKHGKEKAMQIINQEQDRQKRSSMHPTTLAKAINSELYNPDSVFYNAEMIKILDRCELF